MPSDGAPDRSRAPEPKRWLEWDRRRIPLKVGIHVVGRDKDAGVRLNASTVSRQHARLVVTISEVRLEDLASKNGTFHGDDRVLASVRLKDGDIVGFGDVRLLFRAPAPDETTATHLALPG